MIGTRTWGGLVGISRGIGLMDGGQVTFPEFGLFNVNGEWDVENYGVDPDHRGRQPAPRGDRRS